MQYNNFQVTQQQLLQQQGETPIPNGPSIAFQTYFEQMPGAEIPFRQMQKMQSFQQYNRTGSLSDQTISTMNNPDNQMSDKLKQYSNFIPPAAQQLLLLQDQAKKKKYILQNYQHISNAECLMETVCMQVDCRQLPRLCCSECIEHLHPQHQSESVEQFFQRQRERLKRKDGIHKTHMHEANQVINQNRKRRMKYWKWAVKMLKKVESECRAIETFTLDKLNSQLSCITRRETFQRLTQLMVQSGHSKIDSLIRSHPELFTIKMEPNAQSPPNLKDNQKEICTIVDQLYILEERERDRVSVNRSTSPSPGLITQTLRSVQANWEKMIKRVMGANKRFSKRMLKSTRMSILENPHIKITEIKLVSENTENKKELPPVYAMLNLSDRVIATIHPNIIQVWHFNSDGFFYYYYNKDFQSFKPKAYIKLDSLTHVIAAPTHGHLVMLHDIQTVWAMAYQGSMRLEKTFNCPIRELRLSRLAINSQETLLFASGGCSKKGFYIVYWSYQKQMILRVVRRPFSFPHEGDLMTNTLSEHIFRCNKNSVDIFNVISGEYLHSLTLRKARHIIEKTCMLKNFQNRDCFCLSTNYGTFYIYAFEDNRYRLVYDIDMGQRTIFHVFYENQLAEEGFFLVNYDSGQSSVVFQDVNKKLLLTDLNFTDEIHCGQLLYKRNPWKNQLSLMLGFKSGLIRVIIMNK